MKEKRMVFLSCAIALITMFLNLFTPSAYAVVDYTYSKDGTFTFTEMVKNTGYDMTSSKKNAYQQLSRDDRILYDKVKRCILDFGKRVTRPESATNDSITRVLSLIELNEPELFWFAGMQFSDWDNSFIYPKYSLSQKQGIEEAQRLINQQTKKLLKSIKSKRTVYERCKYIHDWIITNNDLNSYSFIDHAGSGYYPDLYEVLCGKTPVVESAYTKTFQYLCDLSGVECFSVHSFMPFSYWGWDFDACISCSIVKTNGKWCNVCVPLDDDCGNEYVAKYKDYISYACFLVPDSGVEYNDKGYRYIFTDDSTTRLKEITVPKCETSAYSYYKKSKKTFGSAGSLRKGLRSQMKALLSSGKKGGVLQAKYTFGASTDDICSIIEEEVYANVSSKDYKYFDPIIKSEEGIIVIVIYDIE